MKATSHDLLARIAPVLTAVKRYAVIIFLVVVCVVYGFLASRINSLTQIEPDPNAVAEKLQALPSPRVDQSAIDKMRQLEEENIEVQTLFQEARDNPFNE